MTSTDSQRCDHFASARNPDPLTQACEECLRLGQKWVALRVCLTCGHVGCCEDSPSAHALAHFQSTGHPLIRPLERRERWTWCYVHNRYYAALDDEGRHERHGTRGGWLRRLFGSRAQR